MSTSKGVTRKKSSVKESSQGPARTSSIKKEKVIEYYEEGSEEEPTLNTIDREEEEYLCFLEEFGHIDFTLLTFLPTIHTVEEFQEIRQNDILNSTRFVKQSDLLANNPNMPRKTQSSRRDKKWSTAKYNREHGLGGEVPDDGQTFGKTPDGKVAEVQISNGGPR